MGKPYNNLLGKNVSQLLAEILVKRIYHRLKQYQLFDLYKQLSVVSTKQAKKVVEKL